MTGGGHICSDTFLKSQAAKERAGEIKELEDKKKKKTDEVMFQEAVDKLVESKGCELTPETEAKFTNKDIIVFLTWKTGKKSFKEKKEGLLKLHCETPPPLRPTPWSQEEEQYLQELKKVDIPMADTALGVAAKQSASAVVNNFDLLDEETRLKLLAKCQESVGGTAATTATQDDATTSS